jgi:trehalose 6-phosphate synthase/phosphatase
MRQIKSDLLKDFPKNNPKLMGVRTGRRVLVISNYLPYTVKPGNVLVADATSTTVSRHGGTEMRPVLNLRTALDDLNSPLIDPHEMGLPSSYGRYGDRRSSLGSMVAFREEDDARHPPDYSTPIPSPTVRPLRTKRTGSELTGSSASSLDTFMLDISPSPWKVAPFFGGNSGLHNAINAAKEICQDRLWVGTLPTDLPKDPSERNNVLNKLRHSYNSLVVELPAGDKQHPGNYYRYCKRVMWPIFHNMLPDHHLALQSGTNQDDWESYVQLNKAFADSVIAEYQPGDIIWVNDYHLMLVPQLVRAVLPDATMGFFLHVPFPTSEIFRCLPVRQEILQGILAADLIGFQTYGYARHFFQSCTRILGYSCTPRGVQMEDRLVTVGIFPIGIVPGSIERKLQSLEVSEIAEQLCEKYTGKMIIVSRDKVDPVKGIREKLLGFSQFLEDYPEWRGRVVLIQVAVTGQDRCLQNISRIAAGINARFECLATCYTPVVLIAQDVSFPHYLALLSVANVCLITSLRDGMNLTSHEFVLCQKDRNHGPLIISEFAGTSTTFSAALRVNPWDSIVNFVIS